MTDDELLDKVARIALAIQRGGGDHLGDVGTIHKDFIDILKKKLALKLLKDLISDG